MAQGDHRYAGHGRQEKMKDILSFYSDALEKIANAPTEHVAVMDRIMSQAQAQITQERFMSIIERLVAPKPDMTMNQDADDRLAQTVASFAQMPVEPEVGSSHPSPFSGGINFGMEEPVLSTEEQEADEQLRAEVLAASQSKLDRILKERK
jgi:hypothetical protein